MSTRLLTPTHPSGTPPAARRGGTVRGDVRVLAVLLGMAALVLITPATLLGAAGIDWTGRASVLDHRWTSVTYGGGLFVAVSSDGVGNRVMTSPDGITWTGRASAADNNWFSVTYGEGLFVAVSSNGNGNQVMTSPDGITWTSRASAGNNVWYSVTHGGGVFVAVAASGNRVMRSPNGITWTIRTSPGDTEWLSVTYGGGQFVAVALRSRGAHVMTSPDGITWTPSSSVGGGQWTSVTYGSGLFVAVNADEGREGVITSPDGINWTDRSTPAPSAWNSVTYARGLFVAVSGTAAHGIPVMTSGVLTPSTPDPDPIAALRARTGCSKGRCITVGPVPTAAARITQSAIGGTAAASSVHLLAVPRGRTARGRCAIRTTGKGREAKRTYGCTIRLTAGTWTLTTRALSPGGAVVAQAVKAVRVK